MVIRLLSELLEMVPVPAWEIVEPAAPADRSPQEAGGYLAKHTQEECVCAHTHTQDGWQDPNLPLQPNSRIPAARKMFLKQETAESFLN